MGLKMPLSLRRELRFRVGLSSFEAATPETGKTAPGHSPYRVATA